VLIEAVGLALIWQAPGPLVAGAGAAITGFGYALVYPGLGVEAVNRAPPQSRGLVMGMYTAFLDVALGLGSPALGLIAGWAGLGSVFLASTLAVLCAAIVAALLLLPYRRQELACPSTSHPTGLKGQHHAKCAQSEEQDTNPKTKTWKQQSSGVSHRLRLYGIRLRLCQQGQPARGHRTDPSGM
jgi:MFS family permease